MRSEYSSHLREDVNTRVQAELRARGIVNISAVAEEVRLRNLAENVALEDIEHLVMHAAQLYGAPIEFDGLAGMTNLDRLADEMDVVILPAYHRSGQTH